MTSIVRAFLSSLLICCVWSSLLRAESTYTTITSPPFEAPDGYILREERVRIHFKCPDHLESVLFYEYILDYGPPQLNGGLIKRRGEPETVIVYSAQQANGSYLWQLHPWGAGESSRRSWYALPNESWANAVGPVDLRYVAAPYQAVPHSPSWGWQRTEDLYLGAPPPTSPPPVPEETTLWDLKVGDKPRCVGMMQYAVHALLVSLNLTDTPLSYTPAFGPAVDFTVSYGHKDVQPVVPDTQSSNCFSNLGPQWTFNWLSYITDDPTDPATAKIYAPGGGTETYTGYDSGAGNYTRNAKNLALLVRPTAASYEKQYPDGTRHIFAHSDGAVVSPRRIFLTKIVDPQGNELNLTYNGSHRLEAITDATGKVTTLHYDLAPAWYYRVTRVTDPFGRKATFQYYPDGRFKSSTDPVNITSTVAYEPVGNFVSSMTTPYGTTQFTHGESDTQRWVEITDPLNARERVEYCDFAPGIFGNDSAPAGFFNSELQKRNTFYWDKKAYLAGAGDYTKAQVTHWLKSADGTMTTGFVENEKPALESRIWYAYDGQTAGNLAGTSNQPTKVARLLDDGTTQMTQFSYNAFGHPLSQIDPVGRSTTFSYHGNGVDLHEVRQTTGGINVLLARMENYAAHLPQTITDAAGQSSLITYNGRGQALTVTNAKGEVTSLAYDETAAHPEFGRSLTITRAFGTALAASTILGYDAYGRVATATDSEGYTVSHGYDAVGGNPLQTLDRPTRTTFPDGSYQESRYDDARWPLDIAHTRDRLGRLTTMEYNAVRQPLMVTDPQGRATQFVQCPCGAMDKIIDARGNETEWTRDLRKRVTSKKIAGQTVATYEYEPSTSRVAKVTDALGQITQYTYAADNLLSGVSYSNAVHATPSVTLAYDAAFPRLAAMTDGTGVTSYGYVAYNSGDAIYGDGSLASVNGPLTDDTITYEYDKLGRRLKRSINGVANESTQDYDALGRVSVVNNPLGQFQPTYVNQTARLDHVLWPNGQRVNYAWKSNLQDQRLDSITYLDVASETQSQHVYSYDVEGRILTWQRTVAGATVKDTFGYNASDELEQAVQRAEPALTLLHQRSYGYDKSGNRVAVTEDGKFTSTPANAKNQLTAASGTGAMLFRGTVSEPSIVTLAGQSATMAGLEWDAWANVSPGANSLELRATETNVAPGFNAQTTTRHIDLAVSADGAKTFAYDASGNTTDNGGTQTYEWDAANRLIAINYTGTDLRSEFVYNGLSYRSRIVEKNAATITSDRRFLWEDSSIVEERDASNSVLKKVFSQGEKRGALKIFYVRDHLGSAREAVDAAGTVRARYDYDPYGRRSANQIVTNALDLDFGFTGHFFHAPSLLHLTLYRAYSADIGRWLSRDPIQEIGGLNLYGYVGNNPINFWDPTGLAWESTPTQGLHYNDRGSNFGFGLGTQGGRVVPVPLGGNHTFDEGKANSILGAAMNDKKKWDELRQQNARDHDNPAYRDKPRCRTLGRALRLGGLLGAALAAANSDLAEAAQAYVSAETIEARSAAAAAVAQQAGQMGAAPMGTAIIYGQLMKDAR